MNKKVLVVAGCRPEFIKLFPIIFSLRESDIDVFVLATGQHTDFVEDTLFSLEISPDITLSAIDHSTGEANASLPYMLGEINKIVKEQSPSMIVCQGDTTSTLAAALSALTFDIPLLHVESGLRTYEKDPYPEESNRQMISRIASIHCCPTEHAMDNLKNERVSGDIYITGNTEIDALYYVLDNCNPRKHYTIDDTRRFILVTLHRRENIGAPIENVCADLIDLANSFELDILVTRHPNPKVSEIIDKELVNVDIDFNSSIMVISPMDYISFIYQMADADIIVTDSGGIQESASALGIPTIVARNKTDRPEANSIVCGTDKGAVYREVASLLKSSEKYDIIAKYPCPFGDGRAAAKIKDIILEEL